MSKADFFAVIGDSVEGMIKLPLPRLLVEIKNIASKIP